MTVSTDLVVQGPRLADAQAEALASLCRAQSWRRLGPGAARLADATSDPRLEAECARMRLDYAFVPAQTRLSDFGLVAMDMDSTLITIECIDELAALAGIGPQVADITERAMRGEIEFKESFTRRLALLSGLDTSALERVWTERLELSDGAERLIEGLQLRCIKTLLVSSGFSFFTERLKARLGLDYTVANQPEIAAGKLTGRIVGGILDANGKAENVRRVRGELGLAQDQVIVMGDGANDLAMMAEAGVSIAFRAKPVVLQQATYGFLHVGLDGLLNLFP
jgi:phosphoserine phosphatase